MTSAADTTAQPKKKNVLWMRLFWSLAGAGVSYLLISTPLHFLEHNTHLPEWANVALSFAFSTTFFFFWNYFVNFRTAMHRHEALKRYLIVATTMYLVSSAVLTSLKHINFHYSFSIGKFPLDLDVVATQVFLGGFKFLLYHLWAFPAEKKE